jgi:aminopeptidase N
MRLHYTVPKGLMAVGNGQFEGKTDSQEKETFNWFISYPINTYNVSLYVGKFKKIEDKYLGINGKSLSISHYVLEKNYEKAKIHFKQLHGQLALYEKRFGEYPWYNDGFKLVESPYAGMEHQTAIAYGNGYKNDADSVTDYIILHETAHEWWGNSVTAKDLAHVWLHEGFATYSEALYFEEKDGFKAYKRQLYFYRLFIKNKYPIVVEEGRRWFHFKQNGDVYAKGAWILHSLRMQINDDFVFFDIIKTFAGRNKYKIVESKDFIELVNEKTNSDYNWFFNHYLYNNESPTLTYTVSTDGVLFYKWSNTDSDFNKLKLKLKSQNQTIIITPTKEIQTLSLPKNKYGSWNYSFLQEVLFAFEKDKSLITKYNKLKKN